MLPASLLVYLSNQRAQKLNETRWGTTKIWVKCGQELGGCQELGGRVVKNRVGAAKNLGGGNIAVIVFKNT